jgi:hypothetical protein
VVILIVDHEIMNYFYPRARRALRVYFFVLVVLVVRIDATLKALSNEITPNKEFI